jgi:hypothetical protein
MYDVIYINRARRSSVLAEAVQWESAVARARLEARRRRVGRMFLAGSEPMERSDVILIVDSQGKAA